jgi:two-component system sensor histidine kinase/response regulator
MRLRLLPGLDVDAGLAFVGNSADVFVRLLGNFVRVHEADVHQMVSHAEHADHCSLQRLAHTIKGGAATLGLKGLASLAQQLEQAVIGNESKARVIQLARALETDHATLSHQLTRASDAQPPAPHR